MDFTREPIIETVVTPKEGCKLVVRSSKSTGQEEYFVDAVEVVSFGQALFFRSLERPKAFLVPVSDYEILEVREARMVLKNVGLDRAIKIAGGREGQMRGGRETAPQEKQDQASDEPAVETSETPQPAAEPRSEGPKKRDRRRHYRRRRGRDGASSDNPEEGQEERDKEAGHIELPEPRKFVEGEDTGIAQPLTSTPSVLTSLLPPPPNLISETIAKYKDNVLFKGAFYTREEQSQQEEQEEQEEEENKPKIPLEQPEYGTFELNEEEEEEIYQQRRKLQEDVPVPDSDQADLFSMQNPEEPLYKKPEPASGDSTESKNEVSNGNFHP